MRVRVTKTFYFEMAHALHGYDGPCKNIHGHSYRLSVTVAGKTNSKTGNPKLGMVIDFTDLKKIINECVIKKFDHALVLNENEEQISRLEKNLPAGNIIKVKYQPTCENLVAFFAGVIRNNLPDSVRLHHLKLRETPTSYAEWYAEDNT
ncbi:MAG: 6-carboxytetrahydropterin synthase QueD [Bacteroidetes bacterium]|nr:MAG: 6-carboxytetrahydropterin synthase QueD [Bacteroidota bacterium]